MKPTCKEPAIRPTVAGPGREEGAAPASRGFHGLPGFVVRRIRRLLRAGEMDHRRGPGPLATDEGYGVFLVRNAIDVAQPGPPALLLAGMLA